MIVFIILLHLLPAYSYGRSPCSPSGFTSASAAAIAAEASASASAAASTSVAFSSSFCSGSLALAGCTLSQTTATSRIAPPMTVRT